MKLFDSHTHINNEDIGTKEREELIGAIENSDVAAVVDVGFDLKSSEESADRAAAIPWYYAAVGIHPHDAKLAQESDFRKLGLLADAPGVVAVGEIGLDFYKNYSPKDEQRQVFRRLIEIGLEKKKPIIIHDRKSGGEVTAILKEEGAFSEKRRALFPLNPISKKEDARIAYHCYSGTADEALRLIDMGATISIAGPVTYENSKKLHEVAKTVPLEHLMIETDAPYLTPMPHRGKRNKSPYVEFTAAAIAELKGINFEEVTDATYNNAMRFFGIGQ